MLSRRNRADGVAWQDVPTLGGRPMAGHQVLVLRIGVRVPAPQPLSTHAHLRSAIHRGWYNRAVRKTTVYLPESTEQRMRRAAKRLGKSRAEITRSALEDFLDRSERTGGLPASVGMGENPNATAANYEERLARRWGRE